MVAVVTNAIALTRPRVAAPRAAEYGPGAHTDGAVAPSSHAEPNGHAPHDGCAACGWKRPAAQRVHTSLAACAKLPAGHASRVHWAVLPYEPGLHAVWLIEPAGHALPGVQPSHADRPTSGWCVPAEQSSSADAPSGQREPALQSVHAALESAPVCVE